MSIYLGSKIFKGTVVFGKIIKLLGNTGILTGRSFDFIIFIKLYHNYLPLCHLVKKKVNQNEFFNGQKFVAQKEFGKALEVFTNLRKKENNNDEVLFYLGLIYFELNNYDKSIYYYDKFLKKKPNSILALYNLAFVKQSIGQIESAKNIYLKLIKIDKNKIRPFYGLFTLNPKNLDDEKFDIILNKK